MQAMRETRPDLEDCLIRFGMNYKEEIRSVGAKVDGHKERVAQLEKRAA